MMPQAEFKIKAKILNLDHTITRHRNDTEKCVYFGPSVGMVLKSICLFWSRPRGDTEIMFILLQE